MMCTYIRSVFNGTLLEAEAQQEPPEVAHDEGDAGLDPDRPVRRGLPPARGEADKPGQDADTYREFNGTLLE